MAIKVVLAKAYDRVEWKVLFHIMYCFGFYDSFIELVAACVTTQKFFVLLNGSPHGYFSLQRGIKQGDSMSPALFTIFLDLLS